MKTKNRSIRAVKMMLVASLLPLSLQVNALEFQVSDDLKVDVDTTITYGRQWRVDGRDKNLMGGTIDMNKAKAFAGNIEFKDLVQRMNSDDGTRNYDKWDTVSNRVGILSDINITYQNLGLFLRPQIFYDSVPFGRPNWSGKYLYNYGYNIGANGSNNQLAANQINSVNHWDDEYKHTMGYKARFLDAYAYGSFDLGGHSLDVRVGRQVITWGEALMLQGGIAFAQNRIDSSASTVPGAELKEVFLPTGAVYGSLAVTDSTVVEAYWQYEWIKSTLFPTGSFFEMQDFIDGDRFIAGPFSNGAGMDRVEHNPNNNKQFGFAVRQTVGEGTELGAYIVNYTDKYPMFWAANNMAEAQMMTAPGFDTSKYSISYFDNIRLYGMSLNTVVGGVQVGAEYSYRANAPIVPACRAKDLVRQHCRDASYLAAVGFNQWPVDMTTANTLANAATFSWPNRAEIHNVNIGGTYIFQPNALWDTATLVGELGGWYVGSYSDDELQFAHLGAFTKYGEGMSVQFMPEYKNVFEGVDLTIPFFVNYGIDGSFSTFNYNEHNLWWSVGAEFTYLEHWKFSGYYSDFSGPNNLWTDRDNVSLNVKYTF
ncbi:MAG: DUF1302 family protein [Pseudomonadales bacterium]|jgi:hypothetical protein